MVLLGPTFRTFAKCPKTDHGVINPYVSPVLNEWPGKRSHLGKLNVSTHKPPQRAMAGRVGGIVIRHTHPVHTVSFYALFTLVVSREILPCGCPRIDRKFATLVRSRAG